MSSHRQAKGEPRRNRMKHVINRNSKRASKSLMAGMKSLNPALSFKKKKKKEKTQNKYILIYTLSPKTAHYTAGGRLYTIGQVMKVVLPASNFIKNR